MSVTTPQRHAFDPAEMIRLYAGISRKSRDLLQHTLHHKVRNAGTRAPRAFSDEFGIQRAFRNAWFNMASNPAQLAQTQMQV